MTFLHSLDPKQKNALTWRDRTDRTFAKRLNLGSHRRQVHYRPLTSAEAIFRDVICGKAYDLGRLRREQGELRQSFALATWTAAIVDRSFIRDRTGQRNAGGRM